MAEIVAEVAGRIVIEVVGLIISGPINSYREERRAERATLSAQKQNQSLSAPSRSSVQQSRPKKSILSSQKQNQSLPALLSLPVQQCRAVLIASSNITFGNDCERLVNIAFQTSQAFPTLMNTYADVSRYLRNELAKQYPEEYFYIILGPSQKFGFSVDDGQYFAEIVHERYHVLIFTTKQNSHTKLDTHDANSQMPFIWK